MELEVSLEKRRVLTQRSTHFFFIRQFNFSSQPGVANGFWENEAENCLVVAWVFGSSLHDIKRNDHFYEVAVA